MNGDSGWDRESRYEEAELSFDFEAEDTYAAGDKVLEIAKHLGECRGVLDWKNTLDRSNQGPQCPPTVLL
jgi:hypothetical protein